MMKIFANRAVFDRDRALLRSRPRRVGWLLIPLLLVMFAIGARGLYADTVWSDEFHSIEDSGGMPDNTLSLADLWTNLAETNPWHVPGYFYILNGWGKLVGWEPPPLRALSLLIGMLAVAGTYRLGRDIHSDRAGLFAAVILATSAFYLHFLHELRMYTLVTLFAVFEVWLYDRMIHSASPPGKKQWVGLFLGAVGLLYSHYFAVTILFGIGLFHLLFVRKNRRWWQITLTFALAGLAFLPWLGALKAGLALAAENESLHDQSLSLRQAIYQLDRLASNQSIRLLALILLSALIVVYRRPRTRLVFVATGAAVAATLALSSALQIMTVGRLRYLISFWPLLAVMIALGIAGVKDLLPKRLPGRSLLPIVIVLVWAGIGLKRNAEPRFLSNLNGTKYTLQLHYAAYAIRDHVQANDLIVQPLSIDSSPLQVYFAQATEKVYFRSLTAPYALYPTSEDPEGQREQLSALVGSLAGRDHVWVIYDPTRKNPGLAQILGRLNATYAACPPPLDLAVIRVSEFAPSDDACLPGTPVSAGT